MSVYIIGQMKINQRDWMEEYFSKLPAIIKKYDGKYLVKGGDSKKLEGLDKLPDAIFILEFNTKEKALMFWNSKEFSPLVKLRQSGSELNATLVDGV